MAKRRKRAPAAWGGPGGPRPKFVLSDDQWKEIATITGMPSDARREIENAISMYRRFVVDGSARVPSAETRREFMSVREDTLALRVRLVRLIGNPDAHFALTVAKQPEENRPVTAPRTSRLDGHRRLESAIAELQHLADWIAVASPRLEPTKRGPDTRDVYWLVEALDLSREKFTGSKITRSYKDAASKAYIAAVCRIADSDIGAGTIEHAMKDRIRGRARGRITP